MEVGLEGCYVPWDVYILRAGERGHFEAWGSLGTEA